MRDSISCVHGLLYDLVMSLAERAAFGSIRQRLLAPLEGEIVEVGCGTGVDFRYYAPGVRVLALEADPAMIARAIPRVRAARATIDLVRAGDEALETLAPESVDVVVLPLVLCTIADPARTLRRAHSGAIAGGCRPNQETMHLVRDAGFATDEVRAMRLPGVSPIRDVAYGSATP